MSHCLLFIIIFFFNDTATTEIYTLSLHDALPIYGKLGGQAAVPEASGIWRDLTGNVNTLASNLTTQVRNIDRKSTRLNSSHRCISYAVFCLKKKNKYTIDIDVRE